MPIVIGSALIPWAIIDLGADDSSLLRSLAGLVALHLMLIGWPIALGVAAERSRRDGRMESTDVLLPRVWAHIFDLALLYVPAALIFGSENAAPVALLTGAAYHGWLQGRTGWTLGKRIMRLRLVGVEDDRPPGVRRALKRYLTLLIEWTGLIGLFTARSSPTRQRFGDRWANTLVIAYDY